jgi:hypothetical protein
MRRNARVSSHSTRHLSFFFNMHAAPLSALLRTAIAVGIPSRDG